MNITATMVKQLRERTGAGMMECKKALQEVDGDLEAAITAMRKRGQAKAAKRADKTAAEGIIVMQSNQQQQAFMAEINCETDFVARDENFKQFADKVAQFGLENGITDVQTLLDSKAEGDNTFEQLRTALISKIGENVQIRRVFSMQAADACVGTYKHGSRIGVLVALDQDNLSLAKDVAMHIAATNPAALDADALSPELISKEREIYAAQAKESGKPDNIIEKMVEGRVSKFIKEVCLVNQPFVKDPDKTIEALLKENASKITAFKRFEVGEGIEKKQQDFAEEVKAQIQGNN